jgi:hypothetical protein
MPETTKITLEPEIIEAMQGAVDNTFVEQGDRLIIDGKLSESDKRELLDSGVVFKGLEAPHDDVIESGHDISRDAAKLTGAAILTAAERKGVGKIEHADLQAVNHRAGPGPTEADTAAESADRGEPKLDAVKSESVYH